MVNETLNLIDNLIITEKFQDGVCIRFFNSFYFYKQKKNQFISFLKDR